MRLLRFLARLCIAAALPLALGCVVLLLNFTAPNPTGRRYSSASPLMVGSPQMVGNSGEDVLARDLRLARNETSGQTQCVCGAGTSQIPPRCAACIGYSHQVAINNSCIPDFVGATFFADSKNAAEYYASSNPGQFACFAAVAQAANRPFWIFVRVDSYVAPEVVDVMNATGGGVVYYFAPPGYVDPIDRLAWQGLAASGVLLVGGGALLGLARRRIVRVRIPSPAPRPANGVDPADRAARKTQETQAFLDRARDRARRTLDIPVTRDDAER